MKRLLIALGALTLASSVVAADEFRPTGSVKQEIRWYGDKEEVEAERVRFTMAEGGVRFTENFYIDYRVRDYMKYKTDEGTNSKDIRTRLYYDHGKLGNTEIVARERFGVESNADKNVFYYTPEFDFAGYFTPGEHFAVNTFKLRPVLRYQDDNDGNKVTARAGADFLSVYTFPSVPGDLAIEFNIYTRYDDLGNEYYEGNDKGQIATKTDDTQMGLDIELYVYYATDSVTYGGVDFNLYYEFGLDPYSYVDTRVDIVEETGTDTGVFRKTDDADTNWTVYQDFEIQASYAVNTSTSVYGALAVEHANTESRDRASNFKWQPYAYVGWRTKF